MSDDYTPTTIEVEAHWADAHAEGDQASFRRWLADVKAQAWAEGFDAGERDIMAVLPRHNGNLDCCHGSL